MSESTRIWFLTGEPGVGKTEVLAKAVSLLKGRGLIVGGVISREVRVRGVRIGFDLMDIGIERRGTLASVATKVGPKVGKYRVNLQDVAEIGAGGLLRAAETSEIIVCDEVGPMELYSPEFRRAIKAAVECGKPVLGVIHKRIKEPFVEELKRLPFIEVIEVTEENRDGLPAELVAKVLQRTVSTQNDA